MEIQETKKPLRAKAYGHVCHLPGSLAGSGDHFANPGHVRICTEKTRPGDFVIVQEKLDGSCVAVALLDGALVPLIRAGHHARRSPRRQHHLFADWVEANEGRFRAVLREGERLVGEWLAQAHGTRYVISRDPFIAFDLMAGAERAQLWEMSQRALDGDFDIPRLIYSGEQAIGVAAVEKMLEPSGHGAIDPVEGAVWRVQREGRVEIVAKYVRPTHVPGRYLFEGGRDGGAPREVWNS